MSYRPLLNILAPAAVGAILVYFATGALPKVYSSYESLYFPMNPSGGIGAMGPLAGAPSGGDAGAVAGLGGAINYPLIGSGSQTAAGIISSHSSLDAVVRRLRLDERWHTTELGATKILGGQVSAETDKTGLLLIRVNSSSPALCVEINHELLRFLRQRSFELSETANSSNARLVADRLAVAQRDLERAESRVIAVMKHTPLSSVSDVQKTFLDAQKALSDAKISRDEERARLDTLEQQYHRLAASPNVGSTVNALTTLNPAFSELAQELQRRRLQLADSMIAFSSTSSHVYRAKKAYENAEAITNQVKAGARSTEGIASPEIIRARSEMAALDESVTANEAALANAWKDVATSPHEYTASTVARSDFEAALAKVGLLKQEQDRAAVIENRDPARFAVVDEPYEDPTPVAPHRLMIAGLTFVVIAGLCFIPYLVRIVRAAEAGAYSPVEPTARPAGP